LAYDDIDVPMQSMRDLEHAIADTIAEFEAATSNSEALESAISNPLGRNDLRSEAQRFEEARSACYPEAHEGIIPAGAGPPIGQDGSHERSNGARAAG
jgi:hypothetical protein